MPKTIKRRRREFKTSYKKRIGLLKSNIPSPDKLDLALSFDQIFGLKLNEVQKVVKGIPQNISKLVEEREGYRKSGDFAKSDEARIELEKLGWRVEDKVTGPDVKQI